VFQKDKSFGSYKPEVRGFDFRWNHWLHSSGRTVALDSTHPL